MEIYQPKLLDKVKEDIAKAHRKKGEERFVELENSELKRLVQAVVATKKNKLGLVAYSLTARELEALARYVLGNIFDVDTTNIFVVISYRIDKNLMVKMFRWWQDAYQKTENEKAFEFITEKPDLQSQFIGLFNIEPRAIAEHIRKGNVDFYILSLLFNREYDALLDFQEELIHFGIEKYSILGEHLCDLFYTECSKLAIILASDDGIYEIINRVEHYISRLILINMLKKMQIQDLYGFTKVLLLYRSFTGNYGTNMFSRYFSGVDEALVMKYRAWLNHYYITKAFENDSDNGRVKFWSKYEADCEVETVRSKDAFIMKFNGFNVIEFMHMGPIYWLSDDYYRDKVKRKLSYDTTSEFKSWIYHDQGYIERQTHQGYWWNYASYRMRVLLGK